MTHKQANTPVQPFLPLCCDCCGYPAKDITDFPGPVTPRHPGGEGWSRFCRICAETFLSHPITYPELYGKERLLFSSIGWIANMLRDEIRKFKGGPDA